MSVIEALQKGIITNSSEETDSYAQALAKFLPENVILALHGDLGTGKTTFIKGLARGWAIKEHITSPTFNFFSIYKGSRNLLHLDAYRLEHPDLSESLLLEDFLIPPYCLAIEWSNNLGDELPKDTWHLYFEIKDPDQHQIKLTAPHSRSERH